MTPTTRKLIARKRQILQEMKAKGKLLKNKEGHMADILEVGERSVRLGVLASGQVVEVDIEEVAI